MTTPIVFYVCSTSDEQTKKNFLGLDGMMLPHAGKSCQGAGLGGLDGADERGRKAESLEQNELFSYGY